MTMKKYTIVATPIATQGTVFIGLDVHKATIHATVLYEERERGVLWVGSIPSKKQHVTGLIRRLKGCKIEVVYEAGCTGYRLKRWLEELGANVIMTPPGSVLKTKNAAIKTDRRDSLALAEQLRNRQLNPVHDLGDEGYLRRELIRTRDQVRQHRQQIGVQIKSKLLFHGIDIPEDERGRWSQAFLKWLEQCAPSPHLDVCIESLVRIYRHLTQELNALTQQIETLSKHEDFAEDVALLTSIPGIGKLIAMTILLELGDLSRFDRATEFAGFLGLVPHENSSGDSQRKGGLTRRGNRRVRAALVQATWQLIYRCPHTKRNYEHLKTRRPSGTAICATARRLALTMRAMLRDRTPYQPA